MDLDPVERVEHAGDVVVSLGFAPSVARIAIDVIEADRGRLLNPDRHLVRPGSGP